MQPDLKALYGYLEEVRYKPFMWHKHDCFSFTNNAWNAMYGQGWADDWVDRYKKNGKYLRKIDLREEFGFQEIEDALDSRMTRVGTPPPRGALVTSKTLNGPNEKLPLILGKALGISVGSRAAFAGTGGLTFVPIDLVENAWM